MKRPPLYWQTRGLLSWLWVPFSMIYWGMHWLRTARMHSQRVEAFVLCVGNNTVGGTGKTPSVLWLCQQLQQRGYHPHVISRGYGGNYAGVVKVDPAIHIAQEVGDEPLLVAQQFPCWVARRRIQAAQMAIVNGADIIVMDDGLQNPTLHKHFSLLVCDATYGIGNGWMLPAGPCREPFSVSLKKAQAALVIGGQAQPRLDFRLRRSTVPVYRAQLNPPTSLNFHGRKLHPFAGIGHPEKFFATIRQMGADITLESYFPDHHFYTAADLARLRKEADEHQATLVTTQKDAMRLPPEFLKDVLVVPVALHIENAQDMLDSIVAEIERYRHQDMAV